ncbi:MAG: hypothetical protein GC160_29300 [Acidobacteria bacterium]|nr:hypothetical protein [Acidobacteriota bacterium]
MRVSPFVARFLSAAALLGSILITAPERLAAEDLSSTGGSEYVVSPALKSVLEQPRYFRATDPQEQEILTRRRWRHRWIATWAAFAAVNALDLHSSAGKRELNPLLQNSDGMFSTTKGAMFKGALGGGFFALQALVIHSNPEKNYYKPFTFATGAATGAMGMVVHHNYGVAGR